MLTRSAQRPRLNLLFLMADDHAAYVHGADGDRQALTPNLDRLASESIRFARHHCNSPVCTPSRQSLITGLLPHAAGVTQLRTALSTDSITIPRLLKDSGYQTAVFGKMHFNRPASPGLHGFDECQTEDIIQRRWAKEVSDAPVPSGQPAKALPWQPFRTPAREWLNASNLPYPRHDAAMKGTFIADQTCAYLEANRDKPFALWASFQEPHSPFDFPVEDASRFSPSAFTPPRIGPADASQIPLIFRDLSPVERSGIIAAYYSSAHFLDRNVGRVLHRLRKLGLADNTLVVYTADHGYCLGHHGRFEKHCGYDPALRVPLLMRLPRQIRPGVVTDFTEHIDLGPTVLELLGAQPFPVAHGRSLAPYLSGTKPSSPRAHIFSEYLENEEVFIRDGRWKFIYCSGRRARQDGYATADPTPGRYTRLFDLRADPGEFIDVSARNPEVVKRLTSLALERFRSTHPESAQQPKGLSPFEALDFYLRPRDNAPPAA